MIATSADLRALRAAPLVDIWCADLDKLAADELHELLSNDERQRASRFHFSRDRDRYIAGRGLLRRLLGSYLAQPPGQLRFRYGIEGKPALADADHVGLHFNIAHSDNLALLTFTCLGEIGVDVELLRDLDDLEDVARHHFSSRELDVLLALPRSESISAFYRCWTRKEAFVKALGDGLAHPLHDFAVTLGRHERCALVWVRDDDEEPAAWSFHDLQVGSDAVGAVAIRHGAPTFVQRPLGPQHPPFG